MLMVMRPYQITATERILNRIEIANNYKKYGDIAGGGYIWHTTGSGKTLTSFKTARLASQLSYIDKARIIITTIQKLSTFIKKNREHPAYHKHIVIIFDECHRSQFGDMHAAIVNSFKKYHLFGFTGTPIFPVNTGAVQSRKFFTTDQTFGDRLHTYTIVNAINDRNVLPFRVDYMTTMNMDDDIDDEQVWGIAREKAMMAPKRISLVTKYILENFDRKTYRGDKTYVYNALTNIEEVASAKQGTVEEIKQKQRLSGFNSIFAVASVPMAKLYYEEFQRQMKADPTKKLRIAIIYSYGANEEEAAETDNGLLDEENSEDTSALDESSRDFLEKAITKDYNEMFHTNYDTSSEKFQNYYKDVSLRMKNKELDLLIVVNMFLTGFDATTLNTLWADKNLKMHGLIQAFSRTNRILNSIKTFGNIVCFRNLQKRVDKAISLFGDEDAGGIVLMRSFQDYYNGYEGVDGRLYPGYVDMVEELRSKFPLSKPQIIGEQNQKDFIAQFGAILRMRNILTAFDEFAESKLIEERDLQDYLGRYQDLRDEWKRRREKGEATDITDDVDDILGEWNDFVAEEREKELVQIIKEEKLKEAETRKFMENAFRDGEVKTTGTDIDKLMPPVSRFGGGNRTAKKQGVIDKLKGFFERFFGIGSVYIAPKEEQMDKVVTYDFIPSVSEMMVAEEPASYGRKKD